MYCQQFILCYCVIKAFFFVFAFKICLRHQSVTPFLTGAAPPKKTDPASAPGNHGERQHSTHAPLANSKDQTSNAH